MDETLFDGWAYAYDEDVARCDEQRRYPFDGYRRVMEKVERAVLESGARSLLDVGLGTGTLTQRFYNAGLSVTGLDFSEQMLKAARTRMTDAVLLRHDMAEPLPGAILESRYDAIISTYAFHHLEDAQKAALLKSLFALLSPGGVLLIADVAFETRVGLEAARLAAGDEWDASEFYFTYDALRPMLAVPSHYEQCSSCAGVLTLRKPRMLLFDYGGTLAGESAFNSIGGTRALLAKADHVPEGFSVEAMDAFAQRIFAELDTVRIGHRVEVHQHAFQRLVQAYFGLSFSLSPLEIEETIWDGSAPAHLTDGIEGLLFAARAQGLETAVLSNIMYSGEALSRRLESLLPGHRFAFVLATSDYVFRKPDALIFELALRRAGLSPQDAWYLGNDFAADIEGAHGAGIDAVWYSADGGRALPEGCARVADWPELTAWMGTATIENNVDMGRTP